MRTENFNVQHEALGGSGMPSRGPWQRVPEVVNKGELLIKVLTCLPVSSAAFSFPCMPLPLQLALTVFPVESPKSG
jgi:hypothetical protein